MDINQARQLLAKYQAGNCTPTEIEIVERWYSQLVESGELQWDDDEKQAMQHKIKTALLKQIDDVPETSKRVYLLPQRLWWAVAASIILMVGALSYFLPDNKSVTPGQVANVVDNDIPAPQSAKATITLANGQKIYLDSAGNGALAMQGNVKLVKLDNSKIVYQQSSMDAGAKLEYNTLSNPKGSKVINMTLADGSKVWLNAASSLNYPISFSGNERKVSITGEAYFEVAHDATKPFIVNNGNMDVRVLGTHFNVNAFEDDGSGVKVTLLEGSVKIDNEHTSGVLKPGQQAIVTDNIRVINNADIELVMAWKNGYFQFSNASLQTVLKQVARWYNVDVVYQGHNQPRQFVGEIQRDLSLNELLKILEKNKVHFKVQGKELRVLQD